MSEEQDQILYVECILNWIRSTWYIIIVKYDKNYKYNYGFINMKYPYDIHPLTALLHCINFILSWFIIYLIYIYCQWKLINNININVIIMYYTNNKTIAIIENIINSRIFELFKSIINLTTLNYFYIPYLFCNSHSYLFIHRGVIIKYFMFRNNFYDRPYNNFTPKLWIYVNHL